MPVAELKISGDSITGAPVLGGVRSSPRSGSGPSKPPDPVLVVLVTLRAASLGQYSFGWL